MKKHDALAALSALAQDNRLDMFRLLVEAGRLPASKLVSLWGIADLRFIATRRHRQ